MALSSVAFASPAALRLPTARSPRCRARPPPTAVIAGPDAPLHSRLGIQDPWEGERRRGAAEAFARPRGRDAGFHSITLANGDDARETGFEEDGGVVGGAPDVAAVVPKPWDSTTGVHGISYLGRRVVFLRRRMKLLTHAYEECRRITELFSKTFYMGTQLMSEDKQKAVWAVYTWCRRTDELVDGPRVSQRSDTLNEVLRDWHERTDELFAYGKARDSLDLALVDVCTNFPDMQAEPFREMINGMQMDVDLDRFETWDDLYLYCYRVAGTVGLMTLPIMGTVKPGRDGLREASESALALGLGLQLTNILRDVGEDRLRGRIYLPLDELRAFNYTPEELLNCVNDDRYKALIKFQIARARAYFQRAKAGIPLLSPDARLPVQASLDMYSQILDVIEENDYDNFHRRAYISKRKKMATIPMSYLRTLDAPAAKFVLALIDRLKEGPRSLRDVIE